MKIAYFVNSFNAINWGGQATSNGIKYLIEREYPSADFTPLDLPPLPFKKIKPLRLFFERMLLKKLAIGDVDGVLKVLNKYSIPVDYFKKYTHVCFNGEGAIHSKSGHFVLLMALLFLAKHSNLHVAAINQTIDLSGSPKYEKLICKIYNTLDFVSVREPVSLEYAKLIGINNVHLIPDAAYGLPRIEAAELISRSSNYALPDEFVAFAGSSILKRDKSSLEKVSRILKFLCRKFELPIVFLANAKTDIWIAEKLQSRFDYTIIAPPVKYLDAISIVSRAKFLVGGRQHPSIFAYEYSVPYLPFEANTKKNLGVVKLQAYPVAPLMWDITYEVFARAVDEVLGQHIDFNKVKIDGFKIFGEI